MAPLKAWFAKAPLPVQIGAVLLALSALLSLVKHFFR